MRPKARELANGRWREILSAAGIQEELLTNVHSACPLCGGTDRFRFDDKDGRGTYFCGGCGPGDGFTLLQKHLNCGFHEAALFIEDYLLGTADPSAHQPVQASRPQAPQKDLEEVRQKLQKTWDKSRPLLPGDAAWKYLEQTRRLPISTQMPMLRFHPRLAYVEKVLEDGQETHKMLGFYPALIARVTGPEGRPVGLHRTYLTPAGEKAPVSKAKKLMSGLGYSGGSIRLAPADAVLGVAEGIETALAAQAMDGIPVWSCISATMLEQVWIPKSVKEVVIYADNDQPDAKGRRAGQEAAVALAERLRSEGKVVRIKLPPAEGTDFHDLWMQQLSQPRKHAA